MFNYAEILYEEGNIEEAMEYYEKAAHLGHSDSIYNYSMILYQRGNFD